MRGSAAGSPPASRMVARVHWRPKWLRTCAGFPSFESFWGGPFLPFSVPGPFRGCDEISSIGIRAQTPGLGTPGLVWGPGRSWASRFFLRLLLFLALRGRVGSSKYRRGLVGLLFPDPNCSASGSVAWAWSSFMCPAAVVRALLLAVAVPGRPWPFPESPGGPGFFGSGSCPPLVSFSARPCPCERG